MFLYNATLTAGLMISGISFAQAQPKTPTLDMDAHGEVQVALDGHVSDYRLQSKLSPQLAMLVDRNVRTWRFEPIVVDGRPVVAKTEMHIRLEAKSVPGGDNYTVRIVSVNFGDPKRIGKVEPPEYPYEAARARLGAKVLLSLLLDETGRVTKVEPFQTSLTARAHSEADAEHWRRLFERASVAAAKHWHYDLSQTVNGKPIGASTWVPVVFSVERTKSGGWTAFVPGPVHPASWTKRGDQADKHDLSLLADGQALSMDSRFRLKDKVIGKAL